MKFAVTFKTKETLKVTGQKSNQLLLDKGQTSYL